MSILGQVLHTLFGVHDTPNFFTVIVSLNAEINTTNAVSIILLLDISSTGFQVVGAILYASGTILAISISATEHYSGI